MHATHRHPPIDWQRGLFLDEQVFRLADDHQREQLFTGLRWDKPHNYGVYHLSMSLDPTRLTINRIDARMLNGQLFQYRSDQDCWRYDLELDITPLVERTVETPAVVSLLVPRTHPHSQTADFQESPFERAPIPGSAPSPGQPHLMVPQAKLGWKDASRNGYEALDIARLIIATADGRVRIDPAFVPPALSLSYGDCNGAELPGRPWIRTVLEATNSAIARWSLQLRSDRLNFAGAAALPSQWHYVDRLNQVRVRLQSLLAGAVPPEGAPGPPPV